MRTYYLACLALLVGCQSTSRDIIQTGHVLGSLRPANDHVIDVRFDNNKITGESTGYTLLGLFSWGAPNYSNGLEYQASTAQQGFTGFLTGITSSVASVFAGFVGKLRGAAVREACDAAKCDLIGFPMFYVDEENFVIFKKQTWRVVGYPGYITNISNEPTRSLSDLEYLAREGDNVVINVDADLEYRAREGDNVDADL